MERYAAASSSPSATKPFHMADFAAFDEEMLVRYFMDDTRKSRDEIEQDFKNQWGGVKEFLVFCRKEKADHDKIMRGDGKPVFRLGRKPLASDSVETFPLTDELTVRVYAGSDLEQSHTFYFDFFHNQKGPIQKPSDVRVYTQEDGKTVEVLSIFDSLKQSTEGAQWVMKAGEDNLEGQTFIIPEGTLLRIVYSNDQSCLLRIPIRGQASAVWR